MDIHQKTKNLYVEKYAQKYSGRAFIGYNMRKILNTKVGCIQTKRFQGNL
jgi:hypothetical protein